MLSIQEMEALIDKLDQSSIDEFSYEANGAKIKLKKHHSVVQTVTNEAVHIPQTPQIKEQVAPSIEKPSQSEQATVQEEKPVVESKDYDFEVVSPMVGTFYSSPSPPDKPAFVQVGDQVSENTVICIVEAMKLFNEIEADVKGTVTEVLVENGELVEYGQPLFRIKTV